MCDGFSWVAAIAALSGTAAAVQADDSARKQQHANERGLEMQELANKEQANYNTKMEQMQLDANEQAGGLAEFQLQQADKANNRMNARQPDVTGMASSNQQQAKGGQSGTMLTGPKGVDKSTLSLGKTTLLGG